MKRFTIGQQLEAYTRDGSVNGVVTRRTNKTVTIRVDGTRRTLPLKDHDGREYVYPLGEYLLAPIFRA